jgi:hypothetical protein
MMEFTTPLEALSHLCTLGGWVDLLTKRLGVCSIGCNLLSSPTSLKNSSSLFCGTQRSVHAYSRFQPSRDQRPKTLGLQYLYLLTKSQQSAFQFIIWAYLYGDYQLLICPGLDLL